MPKHPSAGLHAELALVERLYVEEPIAITLEELAQQTHISLGTLKEHCSRNNWVGKREKFQEKVQTTYLEKHVPERVDELKEISTQAKRIVRQIMDKLEAELPDMKFRNVDEALRVMSQALKTIQDVEMLSPPPGGSTVQREVKVTQTHLLRQLIQTTPDEGTVIDVDS